MHKLTIPTILIAIVMVAGIFAFMPIEKAITVHTTIQGSQLNQFASVFVTDTSTDNATAGCGSGNAGLVYWTVFNNSLADGGNIASTTFKLTTDGDTENGDEIDIVLASNFTSASGIVSISGSTGSDVIIGAPGGAGGAEEVGDILLSVQCQSGDSPTATSPTP